MPHPLNLADLGRRVRSVRTARRLTLEGVVSRTEFTVSWLSKVETGRLAPSLEGLVRLAEALECGVEELVSGLSVPPQAVVVRNGHGERAGAKGPRSAVHEERANGWRNKSMHPLVMHLPAGGRREAPATSDGQRFLFVLEGAAEVVYGDDLIPLAIGDSVYLDAAIPHAIRAVGGQPARLLSVTCDAVRDSRPRPRGTPGRRPAADGR